MAQMTAARQRTRGKKCLVTIHHSVVVSCCARAILKRNIYFNNEPETNAFADRHTDVLHSGREMKT